MGQTHGGICGIDALPAVSGGPHHIDPDLFFINLHIYFFGFRHHRHRDGRSMDPPSGLRLRHPLNPVDAGLILHDGVSTLAGNHEGAALHASDSDFVRLHHFHFPAPGLGVMGIHPVDLRRKKGRFISSCPRSNLHDDVFLIVGVFGQQQNLQFLFQFCRPLFGIGELLF